MPATPFRSAFKTALERIASIGVLPEDSADVRLKKAILNVTTVATIALLVLYWAPLLMFYDLTLLGLLNYALAGVLLVNLVLFGWVHRSLRPYSLVVFTTTMLSQLFTALLYGNFSLAIGAMLWGLVITLGALVIYSPRAALGWFAAYAIGVAAVTILQPYLPDSEAFPPRLHAITIGANVLLVSFFLFITFYYFVSQRELAYRLLNIEQKKSERLLLNILPREIAAILKDRQQVIADLYPTASILFADVVNFTPLSASLAPEELVSLLDEVFSYFDELVERYDLEKIKTIGDCYMAAAGIPRQRPDHAQALARMALEVSDYCGSHEFQGHKLSFRIGINSGEVVAGVIGRKKFIYDLWGDAVNVASRMESHGAGGVVQVTRATYELIRDEFVCQPRGVVQVKGKGEMEVWHVMGEL